MFQKKKHHFFKNKKLYKGQCRAFSEQLESNSKQSAPSSEKRRLVRRQEFFHWHPTRLQCAQYRVHNVVANPSSGLPGADLVLPERLRDVLLPERQNNAVQRLRYSELQLFFVQIQRTPDESVPVRALCGKEAKHHKKAESILRSDAREKTAQPLKNKHIQGRQ